MSSSRNSSAKTETRCAGLSVLGVAARTAPGGARHSRAEKCFLPGACPCKKQIGMNSAGCGRRNSARPVRALIWRLSFLRFFQTGFFHRARSSKKFFSPNMRFQIWSGALLPERDRGAFLRRKRGSEPQRAVFSRECGGFPLRLFASGLSLRESPDPRPGQGRGSTWQV